MYNAYSNAQTGGSHFDALGHSHRDANTGTRNPDSDTHSYQYANSNTSSNVYANAYQW
jgi:hypothetical protein